MDINGYKWHNCYNYRHKTVNNEVNRGSCHGQVQDRSSRKGGALMFLVLTSEAAT